MLEAKATTLVRIEGGALRGAVEDGVYAFKGVPYAEPIAGPARWRPPQPRRPWEGVRDAYDYRVSCPQFGGGASWRLPFPPARYRFLKLMQALESFDQGDDCLVVNIWSPALDRNARLPVVAYFHGGGLQTGSAHAYDGTRLARKGVVAVSIQYRLGPLGFLHGSGLFPGEVCADNRGFLDQLLALRWIQENIASFGGDPACVTIAGESAGAQSVYILCGSPQAKGLFRRAIAMGGNTYAHAPVQEYGQLARDALQDLGVAAGDVQALDALDARLLVRLQRALERRAMGDKLKRYGSLGASRLNLLGAATGTEFMPQAPLAAFAQGTPNDVDLLLGTCRDEGSVFSIIIPPSLSLSARLAAGHLQGFAPGGDIRPLYQHYRAHLPDAGTGSVYEQINTDIYFRAPTMLAAQAHASSHPGKTFHYQVDCKGSIPGLGAMHGIDVALVLGAGILRSFYGSDAATLQLSDLMLEAWTNFAKTGKPSAPGLPSWAPYDAASRTTMVLDHACRLESDLDSKLLNYWRA